MEEGASRLCVMGVGEPMICVMELGKAHVFDFIAAVGFVLCFEFSASTWKGLFDPSYESSHFCRWGCSEVVT